MNRHRTAAAIVAMACLFFYANVASARPMGVVELQQQAEWRDQLQPTPQSGTLPTLRIEVCAACNLSPADVSAISQTYVLAAYNAGYTIDALSTMHVKILETGIHENGRPYARGETRNMWFRVGNPRSGESIGNVAGRVTFLILSGAR
ncbi:MAG: hypothetical protein IV085_06195 [Thiobacillus sp.]|nr:hypothetical protein [Thiobacillus sp.]